MVFLDYPFWVDVFPYSDFISDEQLDQSVSFFRQHIFDDDFFDDDSSYFDEADE